MVPRREFFSITVGPTVIRVKTAEISQTGRATQGVKMMSVDDGDRVTAVARMTSAKKEAEDSDETEGGDSSDLVAEGETDAEAPGSEVRVDIGSGSEPLEDTMDE